MKRFDKYFDSTGAKRDKVKPPTQTEVEDAIKIFLKKGGKIECLENQKDQHEPPEEHFTEIKSAIEDRSRIN